MADDYYLYLYLAIQLFCLLDLNSLHSVRVAQSNVHGTSKHTQKSTDKHGQTHIQTSKVGQAKIPLNCCRPWWSSSLYSENSHVTL